MQNFEGLDISVADVLDFMEQQAREHRRISEQYGSSYSDAGRAMFREMSRAYLEIQQDFKDFVRAREIQREASTKGGM